MFDYTANAMRKPMAEGLDIMPQAPLPMMQMPAAPMQNAGLSSGSVDALSKFGTAFGNRMDQRAQTKKAGKMTDAPMPQMKRPFEIGPPYEETYA